MTAELPLAVPGECGRPPGPDSAAPGRPLRSPANLPAAAERRRRPAAAVAAGGVAVAAGQREHAGDAAG